MKNLILAMALLLSLTAIAQRGNRERGHNKRFEKMTAEQVATLQTKKMAIALDLTGKQQDEVLKLNLDEAQFRKTKVEERKAKRESEDAKKPSSEERFKMENDRLDRRLAQQEKFKKILTDEQFDLWKKTRNRKGMNGKRKMQREGGRG